MFLYSAVSSLLDRSKRFTLDTLARLFIPTPTSSNYTQRLFTHISTTVYTQVLIVQLSELGRREENENAKALKRLRRGFEPGSLDCESGILPRSTSFLRYCLFRVCTRAHVRACLCKRVFFCILDSRYKYTLFSWPSFFSSVVPRICLLHWRCLRCCTAITRGNLNDSVKFIWGQLFIHPLKMSTVLYSNHSWKS